MKPAEMIKENFKQATFCWEEYLAKWIANEFRKGDRFVRLNGTCFNEYVRGDSVSADAWNAIGVRDWLVRNGFKIIDVSHFGLGSYQFLITFTFN